MTDRDRQTSSADVVRSDGSHSDDVVAVEEPLEIRIEGSPIAVVMRTPGADNDLVLGFCLTEGIVLAPAEVERIDVAGQVADVVLAGGVRIDPERFRRNMFASSSCGICGKASIDAVRLAVGRVPERLALGAQLVAGLPDLLQARQPGFVSSGGLHAAMTFDAAGTAWHVREDVGRHNAVDKVIGAGAAAAWPMDRKGLFVSGRISFEIVQKAVMAGCEIVAGISAPTSLAVDLASEMELTLIGFVRNGAFNVYSVPGRIT